MTSTPGPILALNGPEIVRLNSVNEKLVFFILDEIFHDFCVQWREFFSLGSLTSIIELVYLVFGEKANWTTVVAVDLGTVLYAKYYSKGVIVSGGKDYALHHLIKDHLY
jgi:hypothetical protein